MLLSTKGISLSRPQLSPGVCRNVVSARRLRLPVAASTGGNGDSGTEGGAKPSNRRRSSSKNPSASNGGDVPPPSVQLVNNMAADQARSSSGSSGSSKGSSGAPPPSPAVQIVNKMAADTSKSSSGSSSSNSGAPSTPAAQVASKLSSNTSPTTPAAQVANNLGQQQQQQQSTQGPSSSSSGSSRSNAESPVADLLQQGVRAAAETAEAAIVNTAAAAVGGIEGTASLTQQGLTAAEAAAEDAVRGLGDAAQESLNAAAAVVGGTAGAVDGIAQSAASGSRGRGGASGSKGSNNGSGAGGAVRSADFDTVQVRVPANAWANATREKGRVRDNTLTQDFDEDEVEQLKVQILGAVASLDRGLAANVREAQDVDRLARKLEDAAGPVTLKWTTSRSSPNRSTMDKLAGTWRLIYSSGFNGGSLGGSRPGPPAAFVPTILGQVYQVINAQAMTLDNVVELLLAYGLPQLPFLSGGEAQPTPGLRLTLRHTYEVTPPKTVKIVFESTAAKAVGPDILQGLPELGVPELPSFLKPPKNLRSACFDVTYLDQNMRVTRGDRGELRIYLRDRPLNPTLPVDDSDRDYE